MSSSESKTSYPASPVKQSSDTSSVPTDLTVSSGGNPEIKKVSGGMFRSGAPVLLGLSQCYNVRQETFYFRAS